MRRKLHEPRHAAGTRRFDLAERHREQPAADDFAGIGGGVHASAPARRTNRARARRARGCCGARPEIGRGRSRSGRSARAAACRGRRRHRDRANHSSTLMPERRQSAIASARIAPSAIEVAASCNVSGMAEIRLTKVSESELPVHQPLLTPREKCLSARRRKRPETVEMIR